MASSFLFRRILQRFHRSSQVERVRGQWLFWVQVFEAALGLARGLLSVGPNVPVSCDHIQCLSEAEQSVHNLNQ